MTGFAGLAVPGPTNMPFQVRQAMDVPLKIIARRISRIYGCHCLKI